METKLLGPTLTIGSGSFYYWFNSLKTRRALEECVREIVVAKRIYTGFEICAGVEELTAWTKELQLGKLVLPEPWSNLSPRLNRILLNKFIKSVHIAPLRMYVGGRESELCDAIGLLATEFAINDFTVHPDGVSLESISELMETLPPGVKLSIENMDARKVDCRELGDLALLLDSYDRLAVTFDVCHWLELGRTLDDPKLIEFMKRYQGRISKLHLSDPQGKSSIYEECPEIETHHYLAQGSSLHLPHEFLALLPDKIPVVLEGVIPAGNKAILYQEAIAIDQLFSTSDTRRIAV